MRARSISVVLVALLLAACAAGTTGPTPANGVLLRAADLPDMRLHNESPTLDAPSFTDAVGHGILFKDPAKKVIEQLNKYGFKRAYAELFTGAGTSAGAFVVEFAPGHDLSGMLTFMKTNLFEECPGDPQCSQKSELAVSAIRGSIAQSLKPNRQPDDGKPLTEYKVLFSVGSLIFGMAIGGDEEVYDPGSVAQSRALDAFKTFYNGVKGKSADQIFAAVPTTPLGPGRPAPAPTQG